MVACRRFLRDAALHFSLRTSSFKTKASAWLQMVTIPEKQSILEAIEHLFAKYLEMRPLFEVAARPMKEEWKMRPYFGVFPLFFRALQGEITQNYTFFRLLLLPRESSKCSKRNNQISFQVPHVYVLLNSFHLNGNKLEFHSQTSKLQPPCTA